MLAMLAAAACALTACGQSTIRRDKAQQEIASFVYSQTGVRISDVSCPSGVPAKAGGTYDCHFTAPDGRYVAHVRITSVHGTDVRSNIDTEPLQNTVRAAAIARQISDFVYSHTRYRPIDVSCPQGVVAKVDGTFDCHFTGPDGAYVAHVRITKVSGAAINDDIVTTRVR